MVADFLRTAAVIVQEEQEDVIGGKKGYTRQ